MEKGGYSRGKAYHNPQDPKLATPARQYGSSSRHLPRIQATPDLEKVYPQHNERIAEWLPGKMQVLL